MVYDIIGEEEMKECFTFDAGFGVLVVWRCKGTLDVVDLASSNR